MKAKSSRERDAQTTKAVYRGAGGAILGNNPGIKTKAQADRIIATMLGQPLRQP